MIKNNDKLPKTAPGQGFAGTGSWTGGKRFIQKFVYGRTGIGVKTKILVRKSSGNRHGSSNMPADEFIRGAKTKGHEITKFDVFRAEIRPCMGGGRCGMSGPSGLKDD